LPAELAEQFAGLLWRDLMVSLPLGVAERPNHREIAGRGRDAAAAFLQLHPLPNDGKPVTISRRTSIELGVGESGIRLVPRITPNTRDAAYGILSRFANIAMIAAVMSSQEILCRKFHPCRVSTSFVISGLS
jgi:hypothetical protein